MYFNAYYIILKIFLIYVVNLVVCYRFIYSNKFFFFTLLFMLLRLNLRVSYFIQNNEQVSTWPNVVVLNLNVNIKFLVYKVICP